MDSTRGGPSGPRRLAGRSQTASSQSFCVFHDLGKVVIPDIDVTSTSPSAVEAVCK